MMRIFLKVCRAVAGVSVDPFHAGCLVGKRGPRMVNPTGIFPAASRFRRRSSTTGDDCGGIAVSCSVPKTAQGIGEGREVEVVCG